MNACANGHGNVAIYVYLGSHDIVTIMDIWKHGKYVDTWSVVHLLSGFLLAGMFYRFEYSFLQAFIFSTLLLFAWEAFEWLIKIIEPSVNVMVDIIVGVFGFLIGAYLFYALQGSFSLFFYPVLVTTTALSLWGFIDFLKRGYR